MNRDKMVSRVSVRQTVYESKGLFSLDELSSLSSFPCVTVFLETLTR